MKNAMKEIDRDSKNQKSKNAKPRTSTGFIEKAVSKSALNGKQLTAPKESKKAKPPTTLSEVDMTGLSEEERKRMVSAIRREYQKQYYQKHKEKAKEYQRQYNLTHKKKVRGGRGKASFECPREKTRMTFNAADIIHAPSEKAARMLKAILSGDKMFTM